MYLSDCFLQGAVIVILESSDHISYGSDDSLAVVSQAADIVASHEGEVLGLHLWVQGEQAVWGGGKGEGRRDTSPE